MSIVDGVERRSSLDNGENFTKRRWPDSIPGLPRIRDATDKRGLYLSRRVLHGDRRRAESVLDTTVDRDRHSKRGSKFNLSPADSVSAVGVRSERVDRLKKDPLEALKRIEAQRTAHNRQWEDRATSILGHRDVPRPRSREHDLQQVRPESSMSSLGEHYAAPHTAPVERRYRQVIGVDSPLTNRFNSRSSHGGFPSTEQQTMRVSASLGGRSATSLDVDGASAEHGRLLFEACRSLETKAPDEMSEEVSSFLSTTRTSESVNTQLRSAVQLATQISGNIEMDAEGVAEGVRQQLIKLTLLLREASRTSDQNVRDLTRVMLDLPKMLREGNTGRMGTDIPRRWRPFSPSTSESPLRRQEECIRPSTSMGEYYSPLKRKSRNSIPADMIMARDRAESNTSPFVSRIRALAVTPQKDELPSIEASPPTVFRVTADDPPIPQPKSPEQPRHMLRKKASATSINTVRGSSFLPSASKVRTTTAVSAGELDSGTEVDAASLLAQAAKRREENSGRAEGSGKGGQVNVMRKPSVSERFKATLRRNGGKGAK